MRTIGIILIVFLAIAVAFNAAPHDGIGALLVGAVVYLLVEVNSLRRRIGILERTRSAQQSHEQGAPSPLPTTEASPLTGDTLKQDPFPPFQEASESAAEDIPVQPPPPAGGMFNKWITAGLGWITGGNPVLKVGIIVLFFGVAFLLKYAAQRNMIPVELRLAAVALGGMALLVIGWRLRRNHMLYGLGLEGAGIGVLYLVVFAAAKLYLLLPITLALALMIGLVGLSCALAVLQDSKGLALSGSIGGFLAPVLMSTGSGSHVLLFSYYALLNAGILGIAWFKAWRELNLTGFLFTFAIVGFWAVSAYVPDHFSTTEPFLILFFVMYCLIAVLFAHRQPLQLRGFIDGPQVFGLPIVAAGLQAALVQDFPYGMAVSALALGSWYIGLARILWKRLTGEMRPLVEAFLALGIVFSSLAIPLGLDSHWTTAAWALEGAAMVWVGVRQNRLLARIFGMLLQVGAAVAFADQAVLPIESLPFANRLFLGTGMIAAAALFSSYWLDQLGQHGRQAHRLELSLPAIFFAWGCLWWYCGAFRELDRLFDWQTLPPIFLLLTSLTTAFLALLSRWVDWTRLHLGMLLLLPFMLLTLLLQRWGWWHSSLLTHFGWLAWPVALIVQYGSLALCEHRIPQRLLSLWHVATFWLVLLVLAAESSWQAGRMAGLSGTWSLACWGALPFGLLVFLEFFGDRLKWPIGLFPEAYHGVGTDVPLTALLIWVVVSFASSGDPYPLPYLPLINPLELIELAVPLLTVYRFVRGRGWPLLGRKPLVVASFLIFCWGNVVTGRAVHSFADVAYHLDALFASSIFQAALAALWSLLALVCTIWGARREQRQIWFAGAGLLALVVIKLFMIDLAGTGAIGRIVSFLVAGLLMLIIGYFAPLPPKAKEPCQ